MRLHRSLLLVCLLSWVPGTVLSTGRAATPSSSRLTPEAEVFKRAGPATVYIHSERTVQGQGALATEELYALAPSQNRINGMGSGIIIDPRGYIITNEHVVEDVNVIRVRLHDKSAHTARVVARDHEADLALLKIETQKPLPTMPLGTSKDLMVGENVVAIGNAYGYEGTLTAGHISALNRDVSLNKEISYKALIQTDAPINPGNSGGPLLNIHSELIGVNVAIRAGAQGIAFAIPVDTMIQVATEMMSIRKRNRTWHGLVVRDKVELSQEPAQRSVTVERLEANSPAAVAGLKPGDVLVQVADLETGCSLDLERALLDRQPGEHIPVIFRRNGSEQHAELVLASMDRPVATGIDLVWRKLGMKLNPVAPDTVNAANPQLHGGLVVSEVRPEGAAAKASIQRGDILVGLHQWETLTLDNVSFVLNHPDLANFNPLKFYIVRNKQVHRGWFQQVD